MQRWDLINSIFGRELNDADIAAEYSQWYKDSQSTAGAAPPAKKTKVKPGLKELFFEVLKQAVDTENTRREQSGNDPMTIDNNAIHELFNDAITKMKTDNSDFKTVKDAFLDNHQEIKELSDRLQSDDMAEAFLEWNTNFENPFGNEIKQSGYYLSRWSMALVAHYLNCNMQLVLGDEDSYTTPKNIEWY